MCYYWGDWSAVIGDTAVSAVDENTKFRVPYLNITDSTDYRVHYNAGTLGDRYL